MQNNKNNEQQPTKPGSQNQDTQKKQPTKPVTPKAGELEKTSGNERPTLGHPHKQDTPLDK